jgi:hypothetical protein
VDYFLASAAVAGGVALLGPVFRPQAAQTTTTLSGGLYPPNATGLTPSAFLRLPPDAVKPSGWLSTQLQNQLTRPGRPPPDGPATGQGTRACRWGSLAAVAASAGL